MAIAFVKDFIGSASLATPIVATVPAGGVASGHHLLLSMACFDGGFDVSSVVDSKSNSYTVYSANRVGTASGAVLMGSGYIANALAPGDTVSVNLTSALGGAVFCTEFSGLAPTGFFDKIASQFVAFDVVYTSGLTATTTQANELVFGTTFGQQPVTFTPDSPFIEIRDQEFFTSWEQQTQYKIVSSIGQYESSGAPNAAHSVYCIGATFKADLGSSVQSLTPDHGMGMGSW